MDDAASEPGAASRGNSVTSCIPFYDVVVGVLFFGRIDTGLGKSVGGDDGFFVSSRETEDVSPAGVPPSVTSMVLPGCSRSSHSTWLEPS